MWDYLSFATAPANGTLYIVEKKVLLYFVKSASSLLSVSLPFSRKHNGVADE